MLASHGLLPCARLTTHCYRKKNYLPSVSAFFGQVLIDPTVEGFNASRIDVYVHMKGGKRQAVVNVVLDLNDLHSQLQAYEAKRCKRAQHGTALSLCRTFVVHDMNAEFRNFDELRKLTTGPEAGMNHVVFVSACYQNGFMTGTEMYATNIPMWGPGATAPNTYGDLIYAEYVQRPGMGLYKTKENVKHADVADLANQLVDADLLQRHRFLTAWNSQYKDLLGEIW